jgi:hypothetical protein
VIKIIASILLFLFLTMPVQAETDVWLFRGWGPRGFSTGIDQLARKIRILRGIGRVTTLDYMQTQQAYNQAQATPSGVKLVFGGYSCGASSAMILGNAFEGRRQAHVLGIQPSMWCGLYQSTSNIVLAQDTYAPCGLTYGFGCQRYYGRAQHTVLIERSSLHLEADTDPMAQRDVLTAVYCIANSDRCGVWRRHLQRTTTLRRQNGQRIVRLQGI